MVCCKQLVWLFLWHVEFVFASNRSQCSTIADRSWDCNVNGCRVCIEYNSSPSLTNQQPYYAVAVYSVVVTKHQNSMFCAWLLLDSMCLIFTSSRSLALCGPGSLNQCSTLSFVLVCDLNKWNDMHGNDPECTAQWRRLPCCIAVCGISPQCFIDGVVPEQSGNVGVTTVHLLLSAGRMTLLFSVLDITLTHEVWKPMGYHK